MKFLVLAAVYNHRQEWIETLCQSLIDQDHQDMIHVLVLDDRIKGFDPAVMCFGGHRTIEIVRLPERAKNLLHKYQYGLDYFKATGNEYDAVMVCDTDDGYLPDHMSQHAEVLRTNMWSYPEKVYSTYGGTFQTEAAGGRFWASSAYRREALDALGGYIGTALESNPMDPAFDQRFLHRMREVFGEAGHQALPTYEYAWGITHDNHSSGHIDGGVWQYGQIPESPATGPLVPKYNQKTLDVFAMAKVFRGASK